MAIQLRAANNGTASTTGPATVPLPAGTAVGDFCLFAFRLGASGKTLTQAGGTETWTITQASDTAGGYTWLFGYHRFVSVVDAPQFSWDATTQAYTTSCIGLFSDAAGTLAIDSWPNEADTASALFNSVTPTAATASGAGEASVILTVGRAATETAPTTFTYTPSSGWTLPASGDQWTGSANSRFSAVAYQLGMSGTVTPGAESLTDNSSGTYAFSVAHALVSETLSQAAGTGPARPGKTWRRRFRHRQALQQFPSAVAAVTTGPPVYPLSRPVQARIASAARGGWTASRAGVYAQPGAPVKPAAGPVQARRQPSRGGRVASRAGTFGGTGPALRALAAAVASRVRGLPPRGTVTRRTGTYAQAGPPVYPLGRPVQARRLPARGGGAVSRTGVYDRTGSPLRPAGGPVRAQPPPARGGRTASRAGTFTATGPGQAGPPVYPWHGPVQARRQAPPQGTVASRAGEAGTPGAPVIPLRHPVRAQPGPRRGGMAASRAGTLTAGPGQAGPPVYPLSRPVQARRQPLRGGTTAHRAGSYAGTGAAAIPLRKPVGVYRQQLPPPARGRVLTRTGIRAGLGAPVIPWHRPVRGQPAKPLLTGRTASRAGVYTAPLVAPFTVGALTAANQPTATLTATGAGNTLTAATAATAAITATAAPAGSTAEYGSTYSGTYGPQEGTLTASDTRTGGPA